MKQENKNYEYELDEGSTYRTNPQKSLNAFTDSGQMIKIMTLAILITKRLQQKIREKHVRRKQSFQFLVESDLSSVQAAGIAQC